MVDELPLITETQHWDPLHSPHDFDDEAPPRTPVHLGLAMRRKSANAAGSYTLRGGSDRKGEADMLASAVFKGLGLAQNSESDLPELWGQLTRKLSLRLDARAEDMPRASSQSFRNPTVRKYTSISEGRAEEVARKLISRTTARENARVAKTSATLEEVDVEAATPAANREQYGGSPCKVDHTRQDNFVDSAAVAAEIDQVMNSLRILLSDSGGGLDSVGAARANQDLEADDEDDKTNGLQERLLQYRYVRRIEDPPPPLPDMEDIAPAKVRRADKIEANLRPSNVAWMLCAQERLQKRKNEAAERAAMARERREDAYAYSYERGAAKVEEHMARDTEASQARQEQLAVLQRRAALREQKAEEAARRREALVRREEERLQDLLTKKDRRKGRSAQHNKVIPSALASAALIATGPSSVNVLGASEPGQLVSAKPSPPAPSGPPRRSIGASQGDAVLDIEHTDGKDSVELDDVFAWYES